MAEELKNSALKRAEELKNQIADEGVLQQVQYQAYLAGWHAALAQAIKYLMQVQSQNPRNPFDLTL